MKKISLSRFLLLGFFLVYMIVPLIATVAFSFAVRWDRTILPEGLTLEWWIAATTRRAFSSALKNTLFLSFATTGFSILLMTPTAYWAYQRVPKAKPIIEVLTIMPFGIPGVVLALALLRTYARLGGAIVYSPWMLVMACTVIGLPFFYRPVANALNATDIKVLTEAALTLGASWPRIIMKVIVPNIMPGILSGSLLVFSLVFVEFTLANLLAGGRFKTFPIYLVEYTRFDGRQASALAVISFMFAWIISLALIMLASRSGLRREEVIGGR
ncbi:MAG: ABC transporter permease [Anaerolineales bacterium]